MGPLDIGFNAGIGIPYPIKGVMYCTVERVEPGGLYDQKPLGNPEGFVFRDAIGDYYYFYEFSQGGDQFLAKFRAPRGTTVIDFVKHQFRGAVKDVDMDLVLPRPEAHWSTRYDRLQREQEDLAALQRQAVAESSCACRTVRGYDDFSNSMITSRSQ